MKKLIIALIIGAFIMGLLLDGGDITGALVIGMIFLPAVFEKKNVGDRRCQGKTRARQFARQ